jgi:diguanylate cyclase (GGDEF)-like protein
MALEKQVELRKRAMADLEAANAQLESLASVDGLTGIANRRSLDESLEREWRRAIRDKDTLSLLLIDIDYFKQYNDTYGHQAGDACLRSLTGAFTKVLQRPSDLAARYGGEEFALLLPHTDKAGAQRLAESVLRGVQELQISHEASAIGNTLTVSIGIATVAPWQGINTSSLVAAADAALYDAKSQGRNRACERAVAGPKIVSESPKNDSAMKS